MAGPTFPGGEVVAGKVMVSTPDLRRLVDLVQLAGSVRSADRPPVELLDGLATVVGCDFVGYLDHDPYARRVHSQLGNSWEVDEDPVPEDECAPADDIFWNLYWTSPPCSYPDRTGDVETVTTTTDFYSTRQWLRQPMYLEIHQPGGMRYEMMVSLPAPPGRSRRLLFWRESRFSERDRLLLTLLRPHLLALCPPPKPAGPGALSPRQRDLMGLVADGLSNRQVARQLAISEGTVRKHLENIYTRLEVTNRTAAVSRAFPRGTDSPS